MKKEKTLFIQKIITNRKAQVGLGVIVLIGGYYAYTTYKTVSAPITYTLTQAATSTIITTISGTGQVLSDNQVDIKPLASGQVVRVNVNQGQTVTEGQTLAVLDQRSALISLVQAQNNLKSAQANYQKFLNGANDIDKAISQSSIDNSKNSVRSAQQNLVDKIKTVYNQSVDALADTNNLYTDINSSSPVFTGDGVLFNNSSLVSNVSGSRSSINDSMREWKRRIDTLTTENVESEVSLSTQNLNTLYSYFNDLNTLFVNFSIPNGNTSSITNYQTKFSSDRNAVQANISGISNSLQSIIGAKNNLQQSTLSYDSKTSAPSAEDRAIQRMSLENARISLMSAQNNYSNTVVKAPFDGIVASVNAKEGESGASSIATLITTKKITQISVSESDISKIKLGQKVTLTLDALPDLTFTGKVISMDILGTVSQGVVTYNVKIAFDADDDKIKPNMSVSASIITSITADVLAIDSAAVKTRGSTSYVQKVIEILGDVTKLTGVSLSQAPEDTTIVTGVSNDTLTEIVSGLQAGDFVVLKTSKSTSLSSASTNKSALNLLGGSRSTGAGNSARISGPGGF